MSGIFRFQLSILSVLARIPKFVIWVSNFLGSVNTPYPLTIDHEPVPETELPKEG